MIVTPVQFDFTDQTQSGGADFSLHQGVQFGPFNFAFNAVASKAVGNFAVDPVTANTLDIANTLANGNQVRVTTGGNPGDRLPGGLDSGIFYYVINVTGTTLQLSTTSGGSAVSILDAGAGTLILIQRGTPYDLTGWTSWGWAKATREDLDANKIIDFGPTILTPLTNGIVQLKVDDATTYNTTVPPFNTEYSSKTGAAHPLGVWDLIMADPTGERYGSYVRGAFEMTFLATHPSPGP